MKKYAGGHWIEVPAFLTSHALSFSCCSPLPLSLSLSPLSPLTWPIFLLQAEYSGLYNRHNVAISGTHTHASPGGYLQYLAYSLSSLGFIKQNFDAMLDGIMEVTRFNPCMLCVHCRLYEHCMLCVLCTLWTLWKFVCVLVGHAWFVGV